MERISIREQTITAKILFMNGVLLFSRKQIKPSVTNMRRNESKVTLYKILTISIISFTHLKL